MGLHKSAGGAALSSTGAAHTGPLGCSPEGTGHAGVVAGAAPRYRVVMTDDSDLFVGWRDGDRAAGGVLIERHYDAIMRFFATKTGDSSDDLVQQTFVRCAEAVGRCQEIGSFRAFLFGIARNVLYEHIRRRARDSRADPDFRTSAIMDLMPGAATRAVERAEQRHLTLALQRIPLAHQLLIELYYWEGLSVGELALVLDVPPGTVKSRLHQARGLLRGAMEQTPGTDAERATARRALDERVEQVRELRKAMARSV